MHGLPNTAPMASGFRSRPATPAACRGSRAARFATSGTRTAISTSPCAMRTCRVKQAVISPSALSLMYPADGIPGYSREQFIDDLLREHETEIRRCLHEGRAQGADRLHGRPSRDEDRSVRASAATASSTSTTWRCRASRPRSAQRIGVHTCPGGDRDSTHSADVDYAELLPSLFELKAGNFYIALAGETDRARVLKIIRRSHEAGPADLRRRHRSDRSARRDAGGSPRSRPRSRRIHPGRAARHDRRLRLLAVQRRHVDEPRHGVRKDSRRGCSAPRSPRTRIGAR